MIALVISIIVMLILAGVSINAIIGDDSIISRTQYSTFLSEMTAIEEAVQMWRAGEAIGQMGEETKAIPSIGLCQVIDLTKTERLVGEVGYYRIWSMAEKEPETSIYSSSSEFNSEFESEMIYFPAGVQDLFYLNNEALGIKSDKIYVIDAATGMIYSMLGVKIKGVSCYSANMATAVMSGSSNAPVFAESEVSGTGVDDEKLAGNVQDELLEDGTKNPNYNPYGFKIISDSESNNVYKLYNNGDLYGKGIKNFSLNLSEKEIADCDTKVWQNFTIPENIGGYKKLYQGSNTFYVIDNDDYLWAWGSNESNKLGLTQEQQVDYTGREAVKLDVDGKKVKKVFSTYPNSTFCITEDNSLYVAGSNVNYNLGLGNNETIYKFTKVDIKDVNGQTILGDKIYKIISAYRYTIIWVNASNYEVDSTDWYNNNEFYIVGHNINGQFSNGNRNDFYYYYTKVWDGYLYKFDIEQQKSVRIDNTYNASIDVQHKVKEIITGNATTILTTDNRVLVTGSGYHGYQWFDMKEQNELSSTKNFLPLTTNVKENLEIGTNVQKIASYDNTSVLIWRKNNGNDEIFGSRVGITVGIAADKSESGYFYKITLPSTLISEGIKDIAVNSTSAYILSNAGKVYGTGGNSGLGLGKENTSNIGDGFVELNLSKKVISMNELSGRNTDQFMILSCEDGTMFAIGNERIIFRDKVLQKSWKKIASNVRNFTVTDNSAAYVTKDNNIFVSGTDSYILGLGADSSYVLNEYVKVSDFSNNVLEAKIANGMLGIKTLDNKLYVCGYNKPENDQFNGLEHSTNRFELLKDEISVWNIKGMSRFFVSNNEFYEWGQTGDGCLLIAGNKNNPDIVPTKVNITRFKVEDLDRIDTNGKRKTTFIVKGKLYTCSGNSGRWEIVGVSGGGLRPFTYSFGENIIKCAHANDVSSMYLTESGKAYSVGTKSLLGIGETDSTTYILDLQQSKIENVIDIVAGNGFYIAVTKDGKVYGTGSNTYGVLGRWIGIDRKQPNSRYKTAFEWVECPELEI